jgi:hypothetical protein
VPVARIVSADDYFTWRIRRCADCSNRRTDTNGELTTGVFVVMFSVTEMFCRYNTKSMLDLKCPQPWLWRVVLWVGTPRSFGDSPALRRNMWPPYSGSKRRLKKKLGEAGIFLGPKDRGDVFLWNVGLSPSYVALEPRRPYIASRLALRSRLAFWRS